MDELETKRKELLDKYAQKQDFWVWDCIEGHKWEIYNKFNPKYCLRQVLDDEIVLELDSDNLELVMKGISQIGLTLQAQGITFEYWDHEGTRSPHIHIHNLPIKHLNKEQRTAFKRAFAKQVASGLPYDDSLLTGKHMIALEYSQHWKSLLPESHPKHRKTGIKLLVHSLAEGVS